MRHKELREILEILSIHLKDRPHLKDVYDELLLAYNETMRQPDWTIPITPMLRVFS